MLTGTEIKAIRERRANIADAYCRPENGELWLVNAHVAHFAPGSINNHDPTRPRKLLLHKDQILRLSRQITEARPDRRTVEAVPQASRCKGGAGAGQGPPALRQEAGADREV